MFAVADALMSCAATIFTFEALLISIPPEDITILITAFILDRNPVAVQNNTVRMLILNRNRLFLIVHNRLVVTRRGYRNDLVLVVKAYLV